MNSNSFWSGFGCCGGDEVIPPRKRVKSIEISEKNIGESQKIENEDVSQEKRSMIVPEVAQENNDIAHSSQQGDKVEVFSSVNPNQEIKETSATLSISPSKKSYLSIGDEGFFQEEREYPGNVGLDLVLDKDNDQHLMKMESSLDKIKDKGNLSGSFDEVAAPIDLTLSDSNGSIFSEESSPVFGLFKDEVIKFFGKDLILLYPDRILNYTIQGLSKENIKNILEQLMEEEFLRKLDDLQKIQNRQALQNTIIQARKEAQQTGGKSYARPYGEMYAEDLKMIKEKAALREKELLKLREQEPSKKLESLESGMLVAKSETLPGSQDEKELSMPHSVIPSEDNFSL